MRGRMPCLHVSDGSNMYPVQAGEGGARIGLLEVALCGPPPYLADLSEI